MGWRWVFSDADGLVVTQKHFITFKILLNSFHIILFNKAVNIFTIENKIQTRVCYIKDAIRNHIFQQEVYKISQGNNKINQLQKQLTQQ